jgi:GNAT superfamily N-acetyltransferase
VRTEVIDPHEDSVFRRFHEIMWRAEKEDGRPWNPMWTREEMAGIFREPTAQRRYLGLAAYDDAGQMVGAGFLSLSLLDNLDTAWAFVAVEPALRGRGYGAVVLDALVEAARADGRRQLLAGTGISFEERDTSPLFTWAGSLGFTVANTEVQRNLELPVPESVLAGLEAEIAGHTTGYDVVGFSGPLPEELLASWCELENMFLLEAPMGEIDVEGGRTTPADVRAREAVDQRIGRRVYSALAVRDGRVAAHTELSVTGDSDEAFQWSTLVHPDDRGHRLGLAVKIANIRALQTGDPKVRRISTTNAETNAWMVAVNDRLGFEPVAVAPTFRRVI